MIFSVDLVTQILSFLTLVGNFLILFFIIALLTKDGQKVQFFAKNGLLLALIISLFALFGSLFYSEIAGYAPCELCWYQRIFMYPLVVILGIALIKKDYNITRYVIPLTIIGSLISFYHYAVQRWNASSFCSIDGVACMSRVSFHYGYISIPIMALTAFVLIAFFVYLADKYYSFKKRYNER